MDYTVNILDSRSGYLRLLLTVDQDGKKGSWRALDKGLIRYDSGRLEITESGTKAYLVKGNKKVQINLTDRDAHLMNGTDPAWGIKLEDFITDGSVNGVGTGLVLHAWVIQLRYGPLDWTVDGGKI